MGHCHRINREQCSVLLHLQTLSSNLVKIRELVWVESGLEEGLLQGCLDMLGRVSRCAVSSSSMLYAVLEGVSTVVLKTYVIWLLYDELEGVLAIV